MRKKKETDSTSLRTELGTARCFQCSLFESAEVRSLPSEWGMYLALGTTPVWWGRKGHYRQLSVSPFACCLLQMHPKWKKRVVQIKIHLLFFLFFLSSFCRFCGLSAIYTPLSLQKQQINQQNQTSYLCLLVPTSLFLLQMCKTTLSWMVVVETET